MGSSKPMNSFHDDFDENQLIVDWIRLQNEYAAKKPLNRLLWAHAALDEVCDRDPERCWQLIERILEHDSSDFIIGNLAAGPLEDLLCRHGPQVIEAIERAALNCQKIRVLLSGVWRNVIDEDVWDRIQTLKRL